MPLPTSIFFTIALLSLLVILTVQTASVVADRTNAWYSESRSVVMTWVIGTSLIFSGTIVGLLFLLWHYTIS